MYVTCLSFQEPPANRELIGHPLVTCTPHLGASTLEAQSRVAVEIAEQFVDVANGKSLFGAVGTMYFTLATIFLLLVQLLGAV